MVICICDDEAILGECLKGEIESYLSSLSIIAEYLVFTSAKEFVAYNGNIDLLFLDLDMPEMDGIEAGMQFRTKNKRCKIIIETSRNDRMKEVFPLDVFRFLSKPYKRAEIEAYLDSFIKQTVGTGKLTVYKNRIPVELFQNEIYYIRAYDSDCEVFADRTYRTEKSIRTLNEELDERIFFQVNKSVIVNFTYVKNYCDGLFFVNGEKISVSRRKKRDFENKMKEYNLYFS